MTIDVNSRSEIENLNSAAAALDTNILGRLAARPSRAFFKKITMTRAALMRYLARHFRCIICLFLAVISRTGAPLVLFGLINKRLHLVRSVFFCYAGNARYAHHYRYSWASNFLRWHPTPIGIFKQGNAWGLVCASPITEREFTDPANRSELQALIARMSRFRQLLGARQVSFAGILPSYLEKVGLEPSDGCVIDRTGEVVTAAVQQLQREHFAEIPHDIVLLGGSGRIGRQVHAALQAAGIPIKIIDPAAKSGAVTLADLGDRASLVVDVSRRGVLEACIEQLPVNALFLNEVFPEPPEDARQRFKARGMLAYHLAGVAARVYPSLPLSYGNAVPCCAMHDGGEIVPVLKKLA